MKPPTLQKGRKSLIHIVHGTLPISGPVLAKTADGGIPNIALALVAPLPVGEALQHHPGRNVQQTTQMGHGGVIGDEQITLKQDVCREQKISIRLI